VVREPWKFMDDLFFRLVIYRDSDLPAKKLDLERDAGDYINICVNGDAPAPHPLWLLLILDFDVPGELRFTPKVHIRVRNSSIFGKMSTAVRQANEKPEPDGLWFTLSSGEWIRTTDLRVMSQNPESVPFVRRALQISQTDELWSMLAGHAAVANRCSYSICLTWVRQVLFLAFLHSFFQINLFKSIFSWGMRPP
jgi:hypothetical protein